MLTSEQIRAHEFHNVAKGMYRSEEVDDFLDQTANTLAETQRERDGYRHRVDQMAGALQKLHAERDLIQKTMIIAQKTADDLVAQAKDESEQLLNKTHEDVEALLESAGKKAEQIEAHAAAQARQELERLLARQEEENRELRRLEQETAQFRARILDALRRQITAAEELPEGGAPEPPAKAPEESGGPRYVRGRELSGRDITPEEMETEPGEFDEKIDDYEALEASLERPQDGAPEPGGFRFDPEDMLRDYGEDGA
ncbi:MAG: DivIVA domain-containing protein [Oscillospiraceae bacterium]|jgi:cell division initiation protein|nr:DivIVA domain-containing protein [Oscillospiraceae bacterium]